MLESAAMRAGDPATRTSRIVLVSCYELGHEPLGITVPAGVLARAGIPCRLLDLAVSPVDVDALSRADLVAISTPMHTALRLGTQVASLVRRVNAGAHICFFGLYAGLNRNHLVPALADSCLDAEFESDLLTLAREIGHAKGARPARDVASPPVHAPGQRSPGRTLDLTPARDALAFRDRYAKLAMGGERRAAGAVETTRGCKHGCRHCPLPPGYARSFYAIPAERVMDDIATVVAHGARHITFVDADFLNGPTHALRVARSLAHRFPGLTFDYTAKVEHLHRHDDVVAELQHLGNLFVVSAVESFNDAVLAALHKGHTRADALGVIRRMRERGLTLRPTFVPFTPWETRASYADIFDIVEGEGLIEHIDAVQYSIRLLAPEGSLLLDADEMRPHLGAFDTGLWSYAWHHSDPVMDELQRDVARAAADAARDGLSPEAAFERVRGIVQPGRPTTRAHRAGPVPRLTEDWFC